MLALAHPEVVSALDPQTGRTDAIDRLQSFASALPDQSGAAAARKALNEGQLRLQDVRAAQLRVVRAERIASAAKTALDRFDATVQSQLNALYSQIEGRFTSFYQTLNSDDESGFSAQLKHSSGSVALDVDFYGRGMFPPVAYHSEGHQDGMGLCLYLALMEQVLAQGFTFAVLDDVVMSVDITHRRELCQMLRQNFTDTQFIITTHDRTWQRQMVSEGLVDRRGSQTFSRWTVEHGPFVADIKEVWDELDSHLNDNNVSAAAQTLRRYLEAMSVERGEDIRATARIRQDGAFELGEVLPAAVSRLIKLLKDAVKAAKSWDNSTAEQSAQEHLNKVTDAYKRSCAEQWAINPLVHYNAWENLSGDEFKPVVAAFRDLLECFRCPSCNTWLYLVVSGPSEPEALRCDCNAMQWNLVKKT